MHLEQRAMADAEQVVKELRKAAGSDPRVLRDLKIDFDPDPARQPQASAFWPLLEGGSEVVIQDARKREVDDRVFKYVGVAGVDKPRIVQVGVSEEDLPRDD